MFVLDTNVLSAVMENQPVPEVAAWVAAQPEERLFTTPICQAKLLAGVETLPEGRRRRGLEAMAKAVFASAFDGRVLPFDGASAAAYAIIFAARERAGRPTPPQDLRSPPLHWQTTRP